MIDSHAHLEMDAFDHDRDSVLRRAREAGVQNILTLALMDEAGSYRKAFDIVDGHPELVTAVGCHPHDAKHFGPDGESRLEEMAEHPRSVAIGEIGLDYHYNLSPPETQREVLRRQIRMARRLDLPVIIHHREAEKDLIVLLDEEGVPGAGGVLHSFTANRELALAGLSRGFHISFSGILTFKNAESLRDVARDVPMDKLLVETDCPYLAPVPYRGKRNEPAFVRETAKKLAEVKGVSFEEIERATDENFHRLFQQRKHKSGRK
jgi:TatD DNase family protein